MATAASVYTVARYLRAPEEGMGELVAGGRTKGSAKPERPPARNKRVWASVAKPPETVIEDVFAEVLQPDPDRKREWIVLVDGDPTQIARIEKVAERLGTEITIALDFIHLLQYRWDAGNAWRGTGSDAAGRWVSERVLRLMEGRVSDVAAGICRSARLHNLKRQRGETVDKCVDFLLK